MKKLLFASLAVFICGAALPAYAHETRSYQIRGATYQITVGSLGEPVVVDDKSGLDLTIVRNNQPFIGAEEVLKVEIGIGEKKKTHELSTVYGAPGKYKTTTFFTETEELSYRITGVLEDTPVDLMFTCAAAGHQMHSVEDTSRVNVSEGVIRTLQRGAFGCVAEKSEYEFPSASADQVSLARGVKQGYALASAALALAVLALALSFRSKGGALPVLNISLVRRGIVYLAGGILLACLLAYGVYTYKGVPKTDMGSSHGAHPMLEIQAGKPIPTLSLEALKDSKDGYNLHIKTTNFTFTPESVGGPALSNTGHAHLYVNGVKVARVYGPWFNIGNALLKDGENTILVTLNADDHSEWARDGKHLSAETVLVK